jgi:hypothetical protein
MTIDLFKDSLGNDTNNSDPSSRNIGNKAMKCLVMEWQLRIGLKIILYYTKT